VADSRRPRPRRQLAWGLKPMGWGGGEEQWGLGAGFPRPRPWHRLAWGTRLKTDGGGQRQGVGSRFPETQALAPVGMGYEVDDGGGGQEQGGLDADSERPRHQHRPVHGISSLEEGEEQGCLGSRHRRRDYKEQQDYQRAGPLGDQGLPASVGSRPGTW